MHSCFLLRDSYLMCSCHVSSSMFPPPRFLLHVSSSMIHPHDSSMILLAVSSFMIPPPWFYLHDPSPMSLHPCLLANESCPVFPPPASFVQDKQQNQVWGLELMSCLIFTSSLTVVHCKGSSRDSSIQTSLVIYGYVCVGLVNSCVVCVCVSCSRVCFASVRCLLLFSWCLCPLLLCVLVFVFCVFRFVLFSSWRSSPLWGLLCSCVVLCVLCLVLCVCLLFSVLVCLLCLSFPT